MNWKSCMYAESTSWNFNNKYQAFFASGAYINMYPAAARELWKARIFY